MTREQIQDMNKQCRGLMSIKRDICQMEYRVALVKAASPQQSSEEMNDEAIENLNQAIENSQSLGKDEPIKRSISCKFSADKCSAFNQKVKSCPDNYSDKKCEAIATYDVMTPDSVKKLCPNADKMACALYARKFMGCYVINSKDVVNAVAKCSSLAEDYSAKYEEMAKEYKQGEGELFNAFDGCLDDSKLSVFDSNRADSICSRAKDASEKSECEEFILGKNDSDIKQCVQDTGKFMSQNYSQNPLEACSDMANGTSFVSCNGFEYELTNNVINTSRSLSEFVKGSGLSDDNSTSGQSGSTTQR